MIKCKEKDAFVGEGSHKITNPRPSSCFYDKKRGI